MGGCHCILFYNCLPALHVINILFKCILGIARIGIFFSPNHSFPNDGNSSYSNVDNKYPKAYHSKYVAAFIIDWISSSIPTLMCLFTILVVFAILGKVFIIILNAWCGDCIKSSEFVLRLLDNKALRRFLLFDCSYLWFFTHISFYYTWIGCLSIYGLVALYTRR